MKIYTKTGDNGSTSLFGGKRVAKNNLRVNAYGTIDELNAHLGLLIDFMTNDSFKISCRRIQNELFILGSQLATEPEKK